MPPFESKPRSSPLSQKPELARTTSNSSANSTEESYVNRYSKSFASPSSSRKAKPQAPVLKLSPPSLDSIEYMENAAHGVQFITALPLSTTSTLGTLSLEHISKVDFADQIRFVVSYQSLMPIKKLGFRLTYEFDDIPSSIVVTQTLDDELTLGADGLTVTGLIPVPFDTAFMKDLYKALKLIGADCHLAEFSVDGATNVKIDVFEPVLGSFFSPSPKENLLMTGSFMLDFEMNKATAKNVDMLNPNKPRSTSVSH